MIETLPMRPIYINDFFGAILMIIISLKAFGHARRLTRLDPQDVLWNYLFWICTALVALTISR